MPDKGSTAAGGYSATPAMSEIEERARAIAVLERAAAAYSNVCCNWLTSGNTLTERRFSEGERDDTADECLHEELAALKFSHVNALLTALESRSAAQVPEGDAGFRWVKLSEQDLEARRLPDLPDGLVYGWRTKGGAEYMGDGYPVPPRKFNLDSTAAESILVRATLKPAAAGSAPAWRPMSEAPKGELIDIWIEQSNGGVRWCDCYYDSICGQWRTSRPSGHLLTINERHVKFWMRPPAAPTAPDAGGSSRG